MRGVSKAFEEASKAYSLHFSSVHQLGKNPALTLFSADFGHIGRALWRSTTRLTSIDRSGNSCVPPIQRWVVALWNFFVDNIVCYTGMQVDTVFLVRVRAFRGEDLLSHSKHRTKPHRSDSLDGLLPPKDFASGKPFWWDCTPIMNDGECDPVSLRRPSLRKRKRPLTIGFP